MTIVAEMKIRPNAPHLEDKFTYTSYTIRPRFPRRVTLAYMREDALQGRRTFRWFLFAVVTTTT